MLAWALIGLLLLPFPQAAKASSPGEPAAVPPPASASLADDGDVSAPAWQAPAESDPTVIEPAPDRESDPTAGAAAIAWHGRVPRRHASVIDGDIRFRPDGCLPPHGHAPPHV